MIKHTVLPLRCVGVALLLACCQQQDEVAPPDCLPDGSVPIEVSASVLAHVPTRAQTPVELNAGTMGIFRLVANDYTSLENIQYSKAATEVWKPATATTIYVGAEFASLCAYSPYDAVSFTNVSNKTEATLTAQSYAAAKDMSYATTGGDEIWKKTPQTAFTMTHAYARLNFAVTRDATYPTACKITKVTLAQQSGNFLTANTVDISTGTPGAGTASSQFVNAVTGTISTTGITSGGKNDTAIDLLLIPQQLPNGLKVTLQVDGVDYSATIPNGKLPLFVAGSHYTVSLTMQGKGIDWTGVSITRDWTISPVGGGDKDATFD